MNINTADDVVRSVAALLQARGWRLATAESCTGGRIASEVTAQAGSSSYYAGGVVAYANAVKTALLGVPGALIEQHGAVSAPVAEAMARGALERLGADVAVATTGIAGPGGGTDAKPVGLVFIATAVRHHGCRSEERHFQGNREAVQFAASQAALNMLQQSLRDLLDMV